ncbi:MAG: carboxypeptidase-like regulatory domain-containing protein [Planctomycetota bacterium]
MKRASPVVWLLLAAVAAGLLLLLDPFAWLGGERAAEILAPPVPAGPGAASGEARPEVGLAAPAIGSGAPAAAAEKRQAVDPLVGAGRAAFRVLAAEGEPIAGAQLLVVRGETILGDRRTDERGEVVLAADGAPALLFVAVERREAVLAPGRQEIVLAGGVRLGARFVRADGGSPGRLRLALHSDRSLSAAAPLPAAVEKALDVPALWRDYEGVETDAEGRLELAGLPAEWSGRIWLPRGWRILASSDGTLEARARGVRLAEATTEELVVRVGRLSGLRGRLVRAEDGAPLAGATLAAQLLFPGGTSPSFTTTRADAEGRFMVDGPPEGIAAVELRLGSSPSGAPPILALDEGELPPDGELGDVVVAGARRLAFEVRDPAGAPIAEAVVTASGTRSAPTGVDGRGETRWIAREVDRATAEAPGYVPAEVELPAVVVEPLRITLSRGNRLGVKLVLPEGADPGMFKVALRGAERITALPVADLAGQGRHVSETTFPPVPLMQTAPDSFLCAGVSALARVEFYALQPGVSLELVVYGLSGDTVYHREAVAPLAAGEQREIEVELGGALVAFRGRVLDEEGRPLNQAHVQLDNQILAWTNEDGSFLSFLPGPATGTLLLQHRNCATKYLFDYVVPTDRRPVEFRLHPARRVEIEVVDEEGSPVPQGEVWIEHGGFTTNTAHIEGNRHLAASVPDAPFVVMVDLADREYRQEHDPAVPAARVVVPVHGRLVAVVPDATTAGRRGRFVLALVAPEDASFRGVSAARDSAPGLRIELPDVLPGTYEAFLNYSPTPEEEAAAGRAEEHSAPMEVTISAGEETAIVLDLPAGG